MVITTSICANYLDKALVLAHSVKRSIPGAKFILCLVEDTFPSFKELEVFDEVVLAKDLGIEAFPAFIFQYDIVEASTAVKGHLMSFLLSEYPHDTAVYVDPDCKAYSDFTELRSISDEKPIVLAPHLLSPGNVDMEISSLKHGVFNLGFLALKPGEESRKFAKWWGDRLYYFSHADFERGLFTDQKWINLAPCFFNVEILRHPGYDFATWSFMERELSRQGTDYMVDGQPLRFVHFSGYDSGTFDWAYNEWGSEQNKAIGEELSSDYSASLDEFVHLKTRSIPWSYAGYQEGGGIEVVERKQLASVIRSAAGLDPFVSREKTRSWLKAQGARVGVVRRIGSRVKRLFSGLR